MANPDYAMKVGDTLPVLEAGLKQKGGNLPLILTGATVTFIMRSKRTKTIKINRVCTIIDALLGTVAMPWQVGDTDTDGLYDAEFQVVYGDGTEITCPNDSFLQIQIVKELA